MASDIIGRNCGGGGGGQGHKSGEKVRFFISVFCGIFTHKPTMNFASTGQRQCVVVSGYRDAFPSGAPNC